ncbi:hypothetical protein ABOM_007704 [Aspergillus bombycis]|uniref:Uncharacterized protein n=1 Tax=Aspergillus bombycis TaxID=109264 RepID=A0A1F7ZYQ6_9EURO|nr:hypothetical protein ABOM_007704 [Aspergillus bombycis]OGM44225.1 hypothetical protein ABOM_007704 [Aspergillus bombycis]
MAADAYRPSTSGNLPKEPRSRELHHARPLKTDMQNAKAPKSAQFLRRRSARAGKSRAKATPTRSRVTRSRPQSRLSTQHTGLSVVIPVKPELSKKKKRDGEKRTNQSVSVEVANESPLRVAEIASQALHLQEAGEWNDIENELQYEEEDEQPNEEQTAPKDVLPPDPSLLNETRVAQARAAYEPRRMKGPRLPRREAAHPLQKLDATDEDSIGKEALRRVEQDDRRPTNVLIWEVANDLYREKCVQLGMKFQPIGSQWSQRFLIRHPDFRKTWSQLIEARKPPPRAPPPGASSGADSWRFAEDASSIMDDDFSKFNIPKTEAECASYFRQIRSGPPATAIQIQRFLTHLLVEQAKSVDMLSRVRKALEEPQKTNETATKVTAIEPQKKSEQVKGFTAPPTSESQQPPTATASTPIVGTSVGNPTTAPPQPSQSLSQLTTDTIPQGQEPQVPLTTSNPPPRASIHSEERATMARQASSTSLPPPTNRLAQPQPSQEALNTASSTPIISNASSTYTSTPSRSIITFQQFSRNHISQSSHPPDQQEAHEPQKPQGTADSTPVTGNASGNTATPLQSSIELFQSSSAIDPSLSLYTLQSPQNQEARRDEATADSNPMRSNTPPTHPSEAFQSTQSSFQPSTTSIPWLLHHPEPQEAQETQSPVDAANSLSLLSNASSRNPSASLETLLSSFQAYPTTHVRQSPQSREAQGPRNPQKPKKPSQPRKPQQPRARNPQQPQSQRRQQSQLPHYQLPQQQQSQLSQEQSLQLSQPSEPPQPVQPPESPQVPSRSSNHTATTMAPFTGWGSGALGVASSSPYHSSNFATSYDGNHPVRPQYYPNEYLLRTAVDQSSKRRRIDDPINSINHPGFQ